MSRPRKPIKPDMDAFAREIEQMPLDEVNSLRIELGREHADNLRASHLTRAKLDVIRAVMFTRKNGGEIGISDHAVLRYMERHKGIDVRSVRLELAEIAKSHKLKKLDVSGDSYITDDGTKVVILGNVVATVYPKD